MTFWSLLESYPTFFEFHIKKGKWWSENEMEIASEIKPPKYCVVIHIFCTKISDLFDIFQGAYRSFKKPRAVAKWKSNPFYILIRPNMIYLTIHFENTLLRSYPGTIEIWYPRRLSNLWTFVGISGCFYKKLPINC